MESVEAPAIIRALDWVEHALLGSAATILATIAIAGVGALLLTGRIDVRRGGSILLGCFLIFGAASIANGVMSAAQMGGASPAAEVALIPPPYPQSSVTAPKSDTAPAYDPYAGAALPQK